jgi:hypothetical protein
MTTSRSPRFPTRCPTSFGRRYTVQPGDSTFGVTLNALIGANPHIVNPSVIYPGDVLCVPGAPDITLPCCTILRPTTPQASIGTAMVALTEANERLVGVLGINLPPPSYFGDFDTYEGLVEIPSEGAYGFALSLNPRESMNWSGTITFPGLPGLRTFPADTQLSIRPTNYRTGTSARLPVLRGSLSPCAG